LEKVSIKKSEASLYNSFVNTNKGCWWADHYSYFSIKCKIS